VPLPVGTTGSAPAAGGSTQSAAAPPAAVGTAGTFVMRPVITRTRIQTAQRPVGLNNVFIDFQSTRWFAAGSAVEFSADRFTKIGEHHGFPVYQENGRTGGVIYLSLVQGTPGLVAPYQSR
jgi:hypothetical protein